MSASTASCRPSSAVDRNDPEEAGDDVPQGLDWWSGGGVGAGDTVRLAAAETLIQKLLRIAGLTAAPAQMRGPADEVETGQYLEGGGRHGRLEGADDRRRLHLADFLHRRKDLRAQGRVARTSAAGNRCGRRDTQGAGGGEAGRVRRHEHRRARALARCPSSGLATRCAVGEERASDAAAIRRHVRGAASHARADSSAGARVRDDQLSTRKPRAAADCHATSSGPTSTFASARLRRATSASATA